MSSSSLIADRVSIVVSDIDVTGTVPTTTSLQVAARFGKRHTHVLRALKTLLAEIDDEGQTNFGLAEYADEQGKMRPMYRITKDGLSLLAMGFTGKEALQWKLAYISAFNRMADTIRRFVSFGVPGELYARALEAEKREAGSFAKASVAGRALSLRRKEKKAFQGIVAMVREEVQLRLLLGHVSEQLQLAGA